MTTINVQLNLPDEVLARLRQESETRKVPLDVVVGEVLEDYYEEPTNQEILAGLQESMREALAGDTVPLEEALAELKKVFDGNADED